MDLIYWLRADLLTALTIIIVLRLFLPFEWPFTITIPLAMVMNPLVSFLNLKLVGEFSVLSGMLLIWLVGTVIQTIRFIIEYKKISNIFDILKRSSDKKSTSDFMEVDRQYDYPIWIDPCIPFPMILGLKKVILLPNLNLEKSEFNLVLQHEIEHLKHHDNWIKLFLNILLIIYWWFLPVYWFCDKIQLVLEMRADQCATKPLSDTDKLAYVETLLKVKKSLSNMQPKFSKRISFSSKFCLNDGSNALYFRIHYLLHSPHYKRTNIYLILVIIAIPLLTNSIVFEPFFAPPMGQEQSFSITDIEKGYFIQHRDGTYTLYFKGKTIEFKKIPSDFKSVPIVKE